MADVELTGTIRDLLNFYKEEHRIFGKCPRCGEAFRMSEAKLTYGKEPPKDTLTRLKKRRDELEQEVDDLSLQIEDIQGEHKDKLEFVNNTWKERFGVEVDKRLEKKIKEVRREAIAKSRSTTLGKAIERIAPMFSGFGHHPGDVRPLFEPVDFVVFHGLYAKEVTDLVFVEFKTGGSTLTPVQRTIREAVQKKRVHFEERRMSAGTLKGLLAGQKVRPSVPSIEMKEPGRGV